MSTYIVATKHPEFSEGHPEGSIVIDPWRYVKDQPGVEVHRLGQNKPALISILCPSRGRPAEFLRMARSAKDMATHPKRVEIVAYLDENDPKRWDYHSWGDKQIIGDQIVLSEMWNECYRQAEGEILMHCGDDIVFRTPAWDAIVREEFDRSLDKILLVHGDDCSPNTDALATHGFLHRRWVETVGYFVPPLFSSDWNDVWLTEVADMIGRRVKVPIVTEHRHYAFGLADYDQTYREREERGARDGVVELFKKTRNDRIRDAERLRKVMV